MKLGVNVDHIATLRQARGEKFPDVLEAAKDAIRGGANSIVAHLREDRRHIQDADIAALRKLKTHFDMEMAATDEMLGIALRVKPDMATIVPEKRAELTTEGGLDVVLNFVKLRPFVQKLENAGIAVSLFIDPDPGQIKRSAKTGASFIEIHTGTFASGNSKKELDKIKTAIKLARKLGLKVNAGHGLDYNNVKHIVDITGVEELNIGFSIIARSVFTGIRNAVSDMKKLLIFFLAMIMFSGISYAATDESTPDWLKAMGVSVEVKVKEAVSAEAPGTAVPLMEKPMFKDVPSDHWALSSVNRLVRLGVTQGYPDGTFRGSSRISRYETAVFLSKLAHAREMKNAVNEKLLEELKAELYKIRYSLNLYKKRPEVKNPVSGSFNARLRIGNIVNSNAATPIVNAPIGPVFDYRLITNYKHEFDDDSFVRFGIDTMDSNMMGGRDIAREMFEAEGAVNSRSGFGVSITSGPGLIVHHEGPANIFPSEDNKVYLRPNSGIKLVYEPGDIESGLGFMNTSVTSRGAASTNDMYGYFGYMFRDTFLGKVHFKYSLDRYSTDIRATISTSEAIMNMYELTFYPFSQTELNLKYGSLGSGDSPHNSYAGLSLIAKEFFRSGSNIKVYAHKVGDTFFRYPVYPGILGVNAFDRLPQAGTYDLGIELQQSVSSTLTMSMISDVVTGPTGLYGVEEPRSNATFELDMDFGVFENASTTFAYRVFQAPSAATNVTSDMIGLGLRYIY